MGVNFPDQNRRNSPRPATSITTSQRSNCSVVIYRYNDVDINKLNQINLTNVSPVQQNREPNLSSNFRTRSRLVIRNDVVKCNINKNKSGSSGNFSLTLKRGKKVRGERVLSEDINYLEEIHPGDWIMIYMRKSGPIRIEELGSTKPSSGLKFMGIVENVRYIEIDQPDNAMPRLEYIVTGRDFGKVFDMSMYFNPLIADAAKSILGAEFNTDSSKSHGQKTALKSADEIIKKLVSFYLGGELDDLDPTNQSWYVPAELASTFGIRAKTKSGAVSFIDILNLDKIGLHKFNSNGTLRSSLNPLPGKTVIYALPSTGTVWSVLQHMQNSVINELYTELSLDSDGNLKPTLVHRQMPFSNKKNQITHVFTSHRNYAKNTTANDDFIPSEEKTYFVDLPRHEINSSDIRKRNVGKSDHERLNHVVVVPRVFDGTIEQLFVIGMNTPSIQRYGLRSFQAQTAYALDKGLGGKKNYCSRCTHLVQDWFFLSHMLFNGTIIIDGVDEHVEVGTNLFVRDTLQLYHIEGYTHTYEVQTGGGIVYNTEFRVSRGQVFDPSTRKSDFIGPSSLGKEPSTIVTSVLEGNRNR